MDPWKEVWEFLIKNGGAGIALFLITRGLYITKVHHEEVVRGFQSLIAAKDAEISRICEERDEQIEREIANTQGWKQIAGYSTAWGRVTAEGIAPRLPEKGQ